MTKICSKCSKCKPPSGFRVFARSADGLSAWCVECHRDASRAHYLKNKEVLNQRARQWAIENPEKMRETFQKSAQKNRSKRLEWSRAWGKRNPAILRDRAAKRKSAKRMATPAWANPAEIRRIYLEAAAIQAKTGISMHVDHIVPLKSKLVCGLHCEANLRVIPGVENVSKKNYWWPDMPSRAQAQGQLIPHEAPKQTQEALI